MCNERNAGYGSRVSRAELHQVFRLNYWHPETQSDEVFLGDFPRGTINCLPWKTQRTGWFASAPSEPHANAPVVLVPVFIKRKELIDAGFTIATSATFVSSLMSQQRGMKS